MDGQWLLLIYAVPAAPSRKRAFIWRELKKVGAPYLRDGVSVLPRRADTLEHARTIAAKVEEFGGEATLVTSATLEPARSAALVEQFWAARTDEYREIGVEADRLLEHVAREVEHRQFTYAELEELEADLNKLRRWTEQVVARDYFGSGPPEGLRDAFERCESALAAFQETAAEYEARNSGT
jgi:DNA-binding transcriptional regulator PaaX